MSGESKARPHAAERGPTIVDLGELFHRPGGRQAQRLDQVDAPRHVDASRIVRSRP